MFIYNHETLTEALKQAREKFSKEVGMLIYNHESLTEALKQAREKFSKEVVCLFIIMRL
jgi:ribosomal protein L16/L10AE